MTCPHASAVQLLSTAILSCCPHWLFSCRKVAEQVDINDLPEDMAKIATTLLEDKTGTQVGWHASL